MKANQTDWTVLLSALNSTKTNSGTIITDGKKAMAMTVDPAHVMFVKADIDCTGESEKFTVDVATLLKAIAASGGTEQEIRVDRDKGAVQVIGDSKVNVPLLDDIEQTNDLTERFKDYSGMGKLEPARLKPLIDYAKFRKQSKCRFLNNGEKLTVQVGDNENEMAEYVGTGGHGTGSTVCGLEYTSLIIEQAKSAYDVNVGFFGEQNNPIIFEWRAGASARITMILAPWIEEQE